MGGMRGWEGMEVCGFRLNNVLLDEIDILGRTGGVFEMRWDKWFRS